MVKAQLERQIAELSKRIDGIKPCNEHRFYCANCGNPFILNQDQFDRRYNNDKSFYCSAGHGNVFNKK